MFHFNVFSALNIKNKYRHRLRENKKDSIEKFLHINLMFTKKSSMICTDSRFPLNIILKLRY